MCRYKAELCVIFKRNLIALFSLYHADDFMAVEIEEGELSLDNTVDFVPEEPNESLSGNNTWPLLVSY